MTNWGDLRILPVCFVSITLFNKYGAKNWIESRIILSISQTYLQTSIQFNLGCATFATWPCQDRKHSGESIQDCLETSNPVYILTAWNPRSQLLSKSLNQERQQHLLSELQTADYMVLPVTACSTTGDWLEESFAVWGSGSQFPGEIEDSVLSLAQKFEQNAVFKFEANLQILVPVLVNEATGSQAYCLNHCLNEI